MRCFGIVLLLAWTLPANAQGDLTPVHNGQQYTFLLGGESLELNLGQYRNVIFTFDSQTGDAEPVFGELRTLFASHPTIDVLGLCWGLNQTDRVHPHGDLIISAGSVLGNPVGLSGDLRLEPGLDFLADLYRVDNVLDLTKRIGTTRKALEENDQAPTAANFTHFPVGSTAGLTGHTTGSSTHATRYSVLLDSDYRAPTKAWSYENSVFFTIDEDWPGTPFTTLQVLRLDRSAGGTVTVAFDLTGILTAGDVIDAISVDQVHSVAIGQVPSVTFSLTHDSPSLVGNPRSGADLFQFPSPPLNYSNSQSQLQNHLLRTAFSSSIDPNDGDAGGVIGLDPLESYAYRADSEQTVPANHVVIEATSAYLDEYALYNEHGGSHPHSSAKIVPGSGPYPLPITGSSHRDYYVVGSVDGQAVNGGRVSIHGEVLQMVPNTATGASYSAITEQWSWGGTLVGNQQWEIRVDSGEPKPIPAQSPGTTYIENVGPLSPGNHVFGVRVLDLTGPSSGYAWWTEMVTSTVPMATIDSVTAIPDHVTGAHEISLQVTATDPSIDVWLEIDGMVDINSPYTPVGGVLDLNLPVGMLGPHSIEVRGVDATGSLSYPDEARIFMPRPRSGTLLASADWNYGTPRGMTMVTSASPDFLLIVDESGTPRILNPTTLQETALWSSSILGGTYIPHGVAYHNLMLYWTGVDPTTGYTQLFQTNDAGGALLSLGPVTDYWVHGIFPLLGGDLCARDSGDLVINDRSKLPGTGIPAGAQYRGIDTLGRLDANRLVTINPWLDDSSGAVEYVHDQNLGGDTLLLPFHSGGETREIVHVGTDGTLLASAVLVPPVPGTSDVIAYAPIPQSHQFDHVPAVFLISQGGSAEPGSDDGDVIPLGLGGPKIYKYAAPRAMPVSDLDPHRESRGASQSCGDYAVIQDSPPGDVYGVTVATVDFPAAMVIGDVDVRLTLDHDDPEQLTFRLISPSDTAIILDGRTPLAEGVISIRYDDLGSGETEDFQGSRRAAEPLSAFDGEPSFGTWTLEITDHVAGGVGSVVSWCVMIVPDQTPPNIVRGDVWTDGVINFTDVDYMTFFLYEMAPSTTCPEAFDANGDDSIDFQDLTWITGVAMGLFESVGCEPSRHKDLYGCEQSSCP